MATVDPEQERRRLAEFYSTQTDGELGNLAKQVYALSAIARDELKAQLAKRGLSVELPETAPSDEVELRELATVGKFRDLPEALLAKGCLESAGIESFLLDDNVVRLDWFWSNLMGGVKLQVDAEDVEAANAILDQPIPESLNIEDIGEYEQPRCPRCGSLDVNFRELEPLAYVTASAASIHKLFRAMLLFRIHHASNPT